MKESELKTRFHELMAEALFQRIKLKGRDKPLNEYDRYWAIGYAIEHLPRD